MEQRPLRLGDIVDDYCPRERRLTNHAIVAIVEDNIRQTRCTTCDAEHVYKDGKAPRRRKGDEPMTPDQPIGQIARPAVSDAESEGASSMASVDESPAMAASDDRAADETEAPPAGNEFWPAHRTLIRASLPKIEGEQPPPRPIPEFTMHQRGGRGPAQYRGGGGGGWSNGNGHVRHGRPQGEVNGNTMHGGGRHGGGGFGQHGQGRGPSPSSNNGHGGNGHGQPGGGQGQGHPGGGGGRPGGRHRHRGGGRHKNPNPR